MNVSNRDVLIDYILGRLSRTDAEAVEEQARVDSELAQTLGALRRELSDVASFSDLRGFSHGLNRRLHDFSASKFSPVRSETKSDDSSQDSSAREEKAFEESYSSVVDDSQTNLVEEPVSSSDESSEVDSWNSLFSDAFASFADENAEAQERAVAKSKAKVAKKAEIKPVAVVPIKSERAQESEPTNPSDLSDDLDRSNETPSSVARTSEGAVSLYDVEVRTSSRPIRRRKRFEFIPKEVQAPTSADASGFTFKRAVPLALDEQDKKQRKFERILEASAPVLGERVVLTRDALDWVDSIPDFSSSLGVLVRVLRPKLAFNASGLDVDDSGFFRSQCRLDASSFFTRAPGETFVDFTEERFVVAPDATLANFALRRGTFDADLLEIDVATPNFETTFWTIDRVDASDAYLIASLTYGAPSNVAETTARESENAVEYAVPEFEEVASASESVPYLESELLAAAPVESLSEVAPTSDLELLEPVPVESLSEVASTSDSELLEPVPVESLSEVVSTSNSELLEPSPVESLSEISPTSDLELLELSPVESFPEVTFASDSELWESASDESLSEETSDVEDLAPTFETPETIASDVLPAPEFAEVSEPSEVVSEQPKASSELAFPAPVFDVETPTSDAAEYVAPELLAPASKLERESESSEELVADEPLVEELAADEPLVEELAADEPLVEEPVADEPLVEELVADEPLVEELVADEPLVEELVAEEANVEETNVSLLRDALIVPQRTSSYYASDDASLEDAEEFGPTLSAEDRRLAELLGHTPTPLELDEFYWEDWDESRGTGRGANKSSALVQIASGFLYVATSPIMFVGRATLGLVGLVVPLDFRQKASRKSVRSPRKKASKRDAFFDVAIPCVVGVLIAIFLVFPFLVRSIKNATCLIKGNIVHRMTGKVAVPSVLEERLSAAMSEKLIETQLGANALDSDAQKRQDEANAPPSD